MHPRVVKGRVGCSAVHSKTQETTLKTEVFMTFTKLQVLSENNESFLGETRGELSNPLRGIHL